MTALQLALEFWQQGVLLVPTSAERQPLVPYAHWREKWPDKAEYEAIWKHRPNAHPHILTGCPPSPDVASVEMVDVDFKNDPSGTIVTAFEEELAAYENGLLEKLYIEETESGGRHYAYKVEKSAKSLNAAFYPQPQPFDDELAGAPLKYKPVIEIKRQNGMCRCWPSGAIKIIQGDLLNLPLLTHDEAMLIEHVARSFNRKPDEPAQPFVSAQRVTIHGVRPGDDYANNVSDEEIRNLLERHGWHVVNRYGKLYVRKPDATSRGFHADIKNRIFMVHTGAPTAFEAHKGYSAFSLYTVLEHGGNFNEAAKALAGEGWGEKTEVAIGQVKKPAAPITEEEKTDLWSRLVKTRVVMSKPPKKHSFDIRWRDASKPGGGKYYNIAAPDMIFLVSGMQKARKTSIITSLVAAGIVNDERVGFSFNLAKTDEVIWLDTEQAEFHRYQTARRIVIQSLLKEMPDNVHFYSMLEFDLAERLAHLGMILDRHPAAKVIVFDGIVDFVKDFNDIKEVNVIVDVLKKMAIGRIIIPVLHVNRGKGQANGHLGARLEKVCSVHMRVMLNPDDDNISEITFPDTRDEKPPAFSFHVVGPNIPQANGYPKIDYDLTVGDVLGEYRAQMNFPREEPDSLEIPAESLNFSKQEMDELYGSQ